MRLQKSQRVSEICMNDLHFEKPWSRTLQDKVLSGTLGFVNITDGKTNGIFAIMKVAASVVDLSIRSTATTLGV